MSYRAGLITEAPQKKPYDVSYKVRSVFEILDMQRKEVEKVQTLLEVPVSSDVIPDARRVKLIIGINRCDPPAALQMER